MSSDDRFLDAALAIGRRIVADAVWHHGACAWMGAERTRPLTVEYRALGPELYGGTAGIGLFLAHLAVVTDEAAARRTAVGALRHATERLSALPPDRRDGFYAGPLGVAWAAACVAALLGEEPLHAAAEAAAGEARPPAQGVRSLDINEGAAGTIVGRLALEQVGAAVADGQTVLARAVTDAHGWSWPSRGRRHPHHLCGLAHGAAGVGWALLELFEATGEDRFRDGALGAFAYERSWMDAATGTWPDHRLRGYRRGHPHPFPSPAIGTWCHGEAGIALTRLRAADALGPQDDVAAALDATRRRVDDALAADFDDLSLCHGLAGAAETLRVASAGSDAATTLAGAAVERHLRRGDWPCAEGPAASPGLFPGLAGIGWFLLCIGEPRAPSPVQLCLGLDRARSSA